MIAEPFPLYPLFFPRIVAASLFVLFCVSRQASLPFMISPLFLRKYFWFGACYLPATCFPFLARSEVLTGGLLRVFPLPLCLFFIRPRAFPLFPWYISLRYVVTSVAMLFPMLPFQHALSSAPIFCTWFFLPAPPGSIAFFFVQPCPNVDCTSSRFLFF